MERDNDKARTSETLIAIRNGLDFLEKTGSAVIKFFRRSDVREGAEKIGDVLKKIAMHTVKQKQLMKTMSADGWYPSFYVFTTSKSDEESLNEYMKRCLDSRLDDFLIELIESYPKREEILKEAFDLFNKGRYIASIPLFITQIDGVCEDNGFAPYFTDNSVDKKKYKDPNDKIRINALKLPKYLEAILAGKNESVDASLITFYEDVINNAADSYIIWNTKKASNLKVDNPLNRHGIMHGHIDFLEYGTEINSYKIISLLYFVHEITHLIEKE